MTSLEIANNALLRVGNRVLQSLDEDSTDAALINTLLNPTVREVLSEGCWSSAMARVALTQDSTAPAFQYSYSYTLPADFIRLVEVYDADGDIDRSNYWKLEGQKLLTDMAAVNISYVQFPYDFDKLDDLVAQAIVLKLAIKICMPKTDNPELVNALVLEYEHVVQRAKSIDAIENFEASQFGEKSWYDSRFDTLF